ncbi:MAG: lauroyl acyltransferase [Gemmatimonadaceae bacterium]|nr:lauroyl acyltransferase [Acetobacteraceae bacterium]
MRVQHRIEAAAARAAMRLVRSMSPVRSSALFGAIFRWIGPWLPVSRVAHANLAAALPDLDADARRRVVRGVWDNLGRTAGELPHIGALHETKSGPGWELGGADPSRDLLADGGPAIFFSGHLANWEMMPIAAAARGVPFSMMYRPAENKLIDQMILDLRRGAMRVDQPMFPKGSAGARLALAHLARGGRLGLLMDQKMNDGIQARFFGRPAMTAPALAVLALRLRCPVIPAYVERIGPARFRVVCEPPLILPDTGDRAADVAALTQMVNDRLECWIRRHPESWLWLHRRWPATQQ